MNTERRECKCHERRCAMQSNNSDLHSGDRNMKRRNTIADPGKMRRPVPVKRTKIVTEGMYGNSMLYLRFVILWAIVVLADHVMEFRFEFLWPLWMMFRTVYFSFKYEGLTLAVIFLCVALTSDVLCFFFIPLHYIFFAASTYVWVQYVWYTFAEKGVCLPTVALCCVVVYAEGALRAASARPGLDLCRPLAAHSVGYPIFTLGITLNQYVRQVLLLQRQRLVAVQEIYQILKTTPTTTPSPAQCKESPTTAASTETADKLLNGAARRKKLANGDCQTESHPIMDIHDKLEFLSKHLDKQMGRSKSATTQTAPPEQRITLILEENNEPCKLAASANSRLHRPLRCERRDLFTSAAAKEERRRYYRNRDKDKDISECFNSHRTTEHSQPKEQILKVNTIENPKEVVKNHDDITRDKEEEKKEQKDRDKEREREREKEHRDREKEKERDREREREREKEREQKEKERERIREQQEKEKLKEKEKEKEREKEREKEKELEKEREREREQKAARDCAEELRRTRMELTAARVSEAEARLMAEQTLKKQASWRFEKNALERKVADERRARTAAEHELRAQQLKTCASECENEHCKSRSRTSHSEAGALRRDLQRARDKVARLHHELAAAADQVRKLESSAEEATALKERAQHLETALSAETRVKLDLLSALGGARRTLTKRDGVIRKLEKEIEELKAQMLTVVPQDTTTKSGNASAKISVQDGSPLDPNATVYTPKQLCSDA